MDKIEMFNKIVDITKSTGQGLALTIIRKCSIEYGRIVDELIEDGKVDVYVKHYSTSSDEWVVPAGCYSVMKDDDNEHPGALSFIRFYLGINDIGIGIKIQDVSKDKIFMSRYTTWLNDNEKELIELINMNILESNSDELNSECIKWMKSKEWYINNEKVEICFKLSNECLIKRQDDETLKNCEQLTTLLNTNKITYSKEIEKNINDINNAKIGIRCRKLVNTWLLSQEQDVNIQTVINNFFL